MIMSNKKNKVWSVSDGCGFGWKKAKELMDKYGSPLYVYDENTLRVRSREMSGILDGEIEAYYSIKANNNLNLLRIIHEEGLRGEAVSMGEVFVLLKAGFRPEEIFLVCNNISREEMEMVKKSGVLMSVDSISQLKMWGEVNSGGKVSVRINSGIGAGHHEKVVTGGDRTKFGIQRELVDEIKVVAKKYKLKIVGVNQHIGSLILDEDIFLEGVRNFLEIAKDFHDLEFVDIGGGFGVPYKKSEKRLSISRLSKKLTDMKSDFIKEYGKNLSFRIEPGRYVVAESAVLLGTVHTVKENYGVKYIGTDLGFNVLARPMLYDAYHRVEILSQKKSKKKEIVTLVGNICESGDIIARDRLLDQAREEDLVLVHTAGAYGYSMSSDYNCRMRPAEVLIMSDGSDKLIRKRQTFEDLISGY